MRVLIYKSQVKGKTRAPSSKSYTIRGLICAALAEGESEIINPLISDDTEASLRVLRRVGISIHEETNSWRIHGGKFHKFEGELFCGDSAATLRFMSAICSLVPGESRLTAGPSLSKRPVGALIEALRQLGVPCSCEGDVPPVIIRGGKLEGGVVTLPGDISSQFISALLFIAPLAEKGIRVKLTNLPESKPYILMTIDCLEKFGIKVDFSPDLTEFYAPRQNYKPARFIVEGDWSSASYLLALGALAGEVEVENLNLESIQGDKMILDFLRKMGALVRINHNSAVVMKSKLNPIRADLSDCIDLLPTVAALSAVAEGVSELWGIKRARLKESDRVLAVKEGLERMGIKVIEEMDKLIIIGSSPKGALIDTKGDHRIAMAFSILGAISGGTVIDNAECVSKSFPHFWDELRKLGVKWEIV